jgi:hypothetical protein
MSSKATPKPDNPPSPLRFQFLTIRVLDALKFVRGSTSRKQVLLAGVYALARAAHRRDEILTIAAARRPYIASIDIIGKKIGALPGLDPSSV